PLGRDCTAGSGQTAPGIPKRIRRSLIGAGMKSIIERGCASMKKSMKLLVLTAALAVGMAIQAYGAEGTAITSIPLTFSWDTAPKGGEQVGEIYAATSSTQFIVEGAEYDKRDDAWIFGEQPIVEVELS